MKKHFLSASLIVLCCACASHKYTPPTISEGTTSEELITLEHVEPPIEIAVVEELPPLPDEDLYISSTPEEREKALADTTVYEGSTLQAYPYFYYNNQNLHFYLEEKITKAKTEFNITQRGVVRIRVVVERDGSITNPVIEESSSDVLTKHSMAILKQMPNWHPGSIKGWGLRSYTTVLFNW